MDVCMSKNEDPEWKQQCLALADTLVPPSNDFAPTMFETSQQQRRKKSIANGRSLRATGAHCLTPFFLFKQRCPYPL